MGLVPRAALAPALAVAVLGAMPAGSGTMQEAGSGWTLAVLGIAQDGGMPHLGCQRHLCADARAGRRPAEKVSSLGLVHEPSGRAWLFDATPDMPAQLDTLTGGAAPDGIFLTHGHIGHYTGLMFLGKEVLAADGVPVFGTRRMADFLTANGPWSLLVADGHIALTIVTPDEPVDLGDGLRSPRSRFPTGTSSPTPSATASTARARPRSSSPTSTAGTAGTGNIRAVVDDVDLAFLDGTFSSADEIAGRLVRRDPASPDPGHPPAPCRHRGRGLVHPPQPHQPRAGGGAGRRPRGHDLRAVTVVPALPGPGGA